MSELSDKKVGAIVRCRDCGMVKKPRGRSAPMEGAYCDEECDGYTRDPKPGSLWPRESAADFGFPVADVGTMLLE